MIRSIVRAGTIVSSLWRAPLYRPAAQTRSGIPEFRWKLYLFRILFCVGALFGLYAWLVPGQTARQLSAPWWVGLLAFQTGVVFMALIEHLLHRYVLHERIFFVLCSGWWLRLRPDEKNTGWLMQAWAKAYRGMSIVIEVLSNRAYRGHESHHHTTGVILKGEGKMRNAYEITTDSRTEFALFPDWALVAFFVAFFPLAELLQWALPAVPVRFALFGAIALQVAAYEVSHAYMHKPYRTWWKPKMDLPVVGRWFERIYLFHFHHHMQPLASQGVVGIAFPVPFFYFWDWALGTYGLATRTVVEETAELAEVSRLDSPLDVPAKEVLKSTSATVSDFVAPARTSWPLRLMDRWVKSSRSDFREFARYIQRPVR